ncbi:hypothetical protein KV097_17190 [Mumia sp. zg.B17]|uniref:hypothetical protein n=1 Tax=Mumia sp. zg.B17 TaxID=2855446 RepID=UPI001C6F4236|nr:hypothetical protein [Mumia sp. zg.B17]MBW9207675.1 hypothetical protein [Mumia sp. zg.B17]
MSGEVTISEDEAREAQSVLVDEFGLLFMSLLVVTVVLGRPWPAVLVVAALAPMLQVGSVWALLAGHVRMHSVLSKGVYALFFLGFLLFVVLDVTSPAPDSLSDVVRVIGAGVLVVAGVAYWKLSGPVARALLKDETVVRNVLAD